MEICDRTAAIHQSPKKFPSVTSVSSVRNQSLRKSFRTETTEATEKRGPTEIRDRTAAIHEPPKASPPCETNPAPSTGAPTRRR